MNAENNGTNAYSAVLVDLRKKRDEIDRMIKGLEAISGMSIASAVGNASGSSSALGMAVDGNEPAGLDEGAFHGMSIADATKKLLAMRKRKMGNPEIARELAAGGLVMTSADPVNTVGAVLTRRFNQVGDIVKVARGTWGLKEWYPGRTFKPSSKPQTPPDNGGSANDISFENFEELIGGGVAEKQHDL